MFTKNNILKTSLITSIIMTILCGAYAADTMHPIFVISALAFGIYAVAFSIINRGLWIFGEEDDYEN